MPTGRRTLLAGGLLTGLGVAAGETRLASSPAASTPPAGPFPGDDEARRRRLRELLRGPATGEAFSEILLIFLHWPAGAAHERAVAEVARGIASWPDEVRVENTSRNVFHGGKPLPSWVQLIRTIHMFRSGSTPATAIASSPAMAALTAFWIGYNDSDDADHMSLGVLARSPHLRSLKTLSVVNKQRYPGEWLAVATSPVFARLGRLAIERIRLDPHEFEALLRGNARSLTGLVLRDTHVPVLTPILGVPSLVASLRELTINDLGDEDAAALIAATDLRHLTTLDLVGHRMTFEARERLRRAPHLARTRLVFERSERGAP